MGGLLLWIADKFFGTFLQRLAGRAADRGVRGQRFTGRQLRRYRRVITDDFQRHRPGFTGDTVIDIRQVYVPLQYELAGERADIYENIREHKQSVVVGAAGAGKSLLLKNSMLMWADDPADRRIPVLVGLHRCNGSAKTLVDLVAEELRRCGVGRAMAERALATGRLALLFDGLDEVGRDDRDRVTQALRDFAREYRDCQVIVTCRDAVYQGQLEFEHVVRVAELDDAGVRRLLGNWPGIKDTPAVAEIFAGLTGNPGLMRLARSPLLLTMIAYLHVEVFAKSGRRLPASRTAFYDQAIAHLLGRDADLSRSGSLSVYEAGEKKAVLQRVALAMQESKSDDRRTVTARDFTATAKEILPDLNLDGTHVKPMLREILDRSQLMVAVDKTESTLMFRHLTLQEYLAAAELADEPDRLLEYYKSDPPAWRETVKLWCGLSTKDCTKVLAEVWTENRDLALECLAEARRVDSDFAEMIIERSLAALDTGQSVILALGAIAAENRPRGREVMAALKRIADGTSPSAAQAMLCLAHSGQQEAAEALITLTERSNQPAGQALRLMGEVALPALADRAQRQRPWAVDEIAAIGTPAAAVALAGLIWSDDGPSWRNGPTATRAAWWLAQVLRSPDAETGLQAALGTLPAAQTPSYNWIWAPFASIKDDPLVPFCGQVSWLLVQSKPRDIPEAVEAIDPRLGIPVALALAKKYPARKADDDDRSVFYAALKRTRSGRPGRNGILDPVHFQTVFAAHTHTPGPNEAIQEVCELIIERGEPDPLLLKVLRLLGWPVEATVFGAVLGGQISGAPPRIRYDDWATISEPARTAGRFWQIAGFAAILPGLALLVGVVRWFLSLVAFAPLGPIWAAWAVFAAAQLLSIRGDGARIRRLAAGGIALAAVVAYGAGTLAQWLPWPLLAGFGVLTAFSAVTALIAHRRSRISENPFRLCLDATAIDLGSRTSVISRTSKPGE